ncbi:hypothetical protein FB451DRAFT_1191542 [Mycena latifolia]|nr:hypothetical protein FB451DRAFT_1191542 [Mycena latifolia]
MHSSLYILIPSTFLSIPLSCLGQAPPKLPILHRHIAPTKLLRSNIAEFPNPVAERPETLIFNTKMTATSVIIPVLSAPARRAESIQIPPQELKSGHELHRGALQTTAASAAVADFQPHQELSPRRRDDTEFGADTPGWQEGQYRILTDPEHRKCINVVESMALKATSIILRRDMRIRQTHHGVYGGFDGILDDVDSQLGEPRKDPTYRIERSDVESVKAWIIRSER